MDYKISIFNSFLRDNNNTLALNQLKQQTYKIIILCQIPFLGEALLAASAVSISPESPTIVLVWFQTLSIQLTFTYYYPIIPCNTSRLPRIQYQSQIPQACQLPTMILYNDLFELFLDSKVQVSCNTLTCEYKTAEDLIDLIPANTNFHTIPLGNISYSFIDPWYITLLVLQHKLSSNIILDITLPLQLEPTSQAKAKEVTLTRFVFFDNTLIGLRPQIKQIGQRRILDQYTLPSPISTLLGKQKVPFGQFNIRLHNSKIGLLFESEIKYFDRKILEEYSNLGCEIISIVSNYPSSNQHEFIHDIIQSFNQENNRVILFSSMMYAPSSKCLYTGGSQITFGDKVLAQNSRSVYDKSSVIVGRFALSEVKSKRKYQVEKRDKITVVKEVAVNYCLFTKKDDKQVIKMETEYPSHPFSRKSPLNPRQTAKYYIWHLYDRINKRSPFIITNSFNSSTKELIKTLHEISFERSSESLEPNSSSSSHLSCENVLASMLLVCDVENKELGEIEDQKTREILQLIPGNYLRLPLSERQSLPTDQVLLQRIQTIVSPYLQLNKHLIFYTKNPKEIRAIQQLIQSNPHNKIGIYRNLDFLDHWQTLPLSYEVDRKQPTDMQTNIELFLKKSSSEKQMYTRVFKSYPKDIKHIYTITIPKILYQLGIETTKKYDYYLNNNWSFYQYHHQTFTQQIHDLHQQYLKQDQTMDDKIFKIKQIKNQKQYLCHDCQKYYDKDLVVSCECENNFCIDCLNARNFSFSSTLQPLKKSCLVCLKQCSCRHCKIKARDSIRKCHKCQNSMFAGSKSMTGRCVVECTRLCKESFCITCIEAIDQVKISVSNTSEWVCYVCRGICPCKLCCYQRDQSKINDNPGLSELERIEEEAKSRKVTQKSFFPEGQMLNLLRTVSDTIVPAPVQGGNLRRQHSMNDLPHENSWLRNGGNQEERNKEDERESGGQNKPWMRKYNSYYQKTQRPYNTFQRNFYQRDYYTQRNYDDDNNNADTHWKQNKDSKDNGQEQGREFQMNPNDPRKRISGYMRNLGKGRESGSRSRSRNRGNNKNRKNSDNSKGSNQEADNLFEVKKGLKGDIDY